MMRRLLAWGCIFLWAALVLNVGAAQTKKKAAPKRTSTATKSKSSKKAASKSAGASSSKSAAGKKSSSASKSSSSKKASSKNKAARTTWRNRQLAPTPERYKEIQEALASKGYLAPEQATGEWGPGSIDALKHFQADQHIDVTGKINSLSLIALGLGPKHEPAPQSKP